VTPEEAVELARRALEGKLEVHEGEPVTMDVPEGRVVVTFIHVNPRLMPGPDYDARVTLDAATGEVLEILAGS
jgi:hypothetical protein